MRRLVTYLRNARLALSGYRNLASIYFQHPSARREKTDLLPTGTSPEDLFFQRVRALPRSRVLEIGSRRIVAPISKGRLGPCAEYVGLDVMEGPNVDVVGDVHDLGPHFEPEQFDAVVSYSVFEHVAMPWKAALEISRILKPGGLVYIATHHDFPIHELPWDFWRFGFDALPTAFSPALGFRLVNRSLRWSAHTFRQQTGKPFQSEGGHYLFVDILVEKTAPSAQLARWDLDYRRLLPESHFYPKGTYQLADEKRQYTGPVEYVVAKLVCERELIEQFVKRHLLGGNRPEILLIHGPSALALARDLRSALESKANITVLACQGREDQARLQGLDREFGAARFDMVFALNVLSEIEHPWVPPLAISKVVKVGGGVLVREPTSRAHVPGRPDLWRFTNESLRVVYSRAFGFVYVDGGFGEAISVIPDDMLRMDLRIAQNPTYAFCYASLVKEHSPEPLELSWPD